MVSCAVRVIGSDLRQLHPLKRLAGIQLIVILHKQL